MSLKNTPESEATDGSDEPNIDAEDIRDFFLDEDGPLGVSDISEEFGVEDETSESLLEQLSQSGIVRKHPRRDTNGGSFWTLEHPQLRVRSETELANESPLAYKAHLSGEPRDEEVSIEDVLSVLADYEDRSANLSTTQAATKLQITPPTRSRSPRRARRARCRRPERSRAGRARSRRGQYILARRRLLGGRRRGTVRRPRARTRPDRPTERSAKRLILTSTTTMSNTNKSDTQRVNELKAKLEAHEAREYLANYADEDDGPESFEDLDDEVAVKLASNLQKNTPRQNAHTGDELQEAVNGAVTLTSRAEWERRQADDS